MDHFRLLLLLLPLLSSAQMGNGIEVVVEQCQPITVPLCQDMLYNSTIMPTLLGHNTQEEAARDLQQFDPFVKAGCSADLKPLLCFIYVPVCTVLESAVPPCRAVCERARRGCEGLMQKSDFAWPEGLRCDKFPEVGLCVRPLGRSASTPPPVTTAAPADTRTVAPDRSGPPGAKPDMEDSDLQNKTRK